MVLAALSLALVSVMLIGCGVLPLSDDYDNRDIRVIIDADCQGPCTMTIDAHRVKSEGEVKLLTPSLPEKTK